MRPSHSIRPSLKPCRRVPPRRPPAGDKLTGEERAGSRFPSPLRASGAHLLWRARPQPWTATPPPGSLCSFRDFVQHGSIASAAPPARRRSRLLRVVGAARLCGADARAASPGDRGRAVSFREALASLSLEITNAAPRAASEVSSRRRSCLGCGFAVLVRGALSRLVMGGRWRSVAVVARVRPCWRFGRAPGGA